MKRKGAAIVRKKTAGMTADQEIQFWRAQTKALRQRQAKLRRQRLEK